MSVLTLDTADLWVARVTRAAEADGIVVGDTALCVGSAVAGVNTQPVDARLLQAALRVGGTADRGLSSCKHITTHILTFQNP